jgi:hypothetical protein
MGKMNNENIVPEFTVFGGPLSKLGARLGLLRDGTNSIRLGLVIGLLTWIILMFLSLLQGSIQKVFSITLLAGHIRFLLVIPLFFVCETWVAPRMSEFVRNIMNSGLVLESERQILDTVVHRISRMKNFWLVEVLLILATFVLPHFGLSSIMPGKTSSAAWIFEQAGGNLTLPNAFYAWFCLPLFRFLLARWFWHLGLWVYFLYTLNRLKLQLLPTHPDRLGGLGYLEVVHEHFTPLSFAFSALQAASFAEDIISGSTPFESLYYLIPLVLLLNLVFFIGPLMLFSRKLWICRVNGLNDYMVMAHHYVEAFDQTWIKDKSVTGMLQLGTGDIQSLADLTNSVRVIDEMRTVPVNRRLIVAFIFAVVLPFLPFVFMKFNISELMLKLFERITG